MSYTVRDAHTHFFSRVFFETLARAAPGARPPAELLDEAARRGGLEVPGEDHSALLVRWLEQMDEAGVASAVTFASVPEEAEVVAEAAATSSGRLTGYVVANLAAPGAAAFVDRALGELGLRGVVLFPALHHYALADDACRPALERVREHGGVVVVHCGVLKVKVRDLFRLPRAYDARYASPLGLVKPASQFPEVPFVIPHFGGGLLAETLIAGHWCENVHVDTSSSNDWMRASLPRLSLADVFGRVLEVFGPGRILYGSDSSSFPRGYRLDLLEAQQQTLADLGVPDQTRQAIFGGNLERLLSR